MGIMFITLALIFWKFVPLIFKTFSINSDLLSNYTSCIENLCKDLSLELIEEAKIPKKSNYIRGIESLKVSEDIRTEMNEYCRNEVHKYKNLPRDIISDFSWIVFSLVFKV